MNAERTISVLWTVSANEAKRGVQLNKRWAHGKKWESRSIRDVSIQWFVGVIRRKKKINLYDSKRIIYVPIVKLMQNLFVMEGLDLSNWHTPNEVVEILNNFLYFISIYVGILAKPIKKGVFWVVIFTPTAVTVIRSSIFVLHRFTSFTTVTTV